jgi:hypothetical protein
MSAVGPAGEWDERDRDDDSDRPEPDSSDRNHGGDRR